MHDTPVQEDTFLILREIVSTICGRRTNTITIDAEFAADLQFKSNDYVEMVVAVEERVSITIDDHEISQIVTLRQLTKLVAAKQKQRRD